jgi:hypothetical protein
LIRIPAKRVGKLDKARFRQAKEKYKTLCFQYIDAVGTARAYLIGASNEHAEFDPLG